LAQVIGNQELETEVFRFLSARLIRKKMPMSLAGLVLLVVVGVASAEDTNSTDAPTPAPTPAPTAEVTGTLVFSSPESDDFCTATSHLKSAVAGACTASSSTTYFDDNVTVSVEGCSSRRLQAATAETTVGYTVEAADADAAAALETSISDGAADPDSAFNAAFTTSIETAMSTNITGLVTTVSDTSGNVNGVSRMFALGSVPLALSVAFA